MSTVKVIDVNLRGSLFRVGLSFVFRISKVVFYLFRYFIFLIVVKKHAALPMFLLPFFCFCRNGVLPCVAAANGSIIRSVQAAGRSKKSL
jgi:hypothetical protein